MEHVNRPMTELRTFQVTLRDLVKLQGNKFVVDVTNEPHRTYFHGPAWSHMTEVLKMEPEMKCYFYMEQVVHTAPTSTSTTNSMKRSLVLMIVQTI